MKLKPEMLELYCVTDRECLHGRDLFKQVEQAILGGATMIQLREKNMSTEELTEMAKKLVKLCHKYFVPLIVNDDYLAAVRSGADGVHVGIEDTSVAEIRRASGGKLIIGMTAKTVEQAKKAEADGADYIGVGAVFPSPTKTNALRITPDKLREICGSVSIPAVAIGGISSENVWKIRGCGNHGIAVVSAVFGADDVCLAARRLRGMFRKVRSTRTALSVAGSDPSGGAGIQADIKTMQANGVYAMTAVTALTAQNTTGVSGIFEVTPEFTARQIDMVFSDIRPDAVKIGMISSPDIAEAVADRLICWKAENIVVDPVAVSTSGSSLSSTAAYEVIKKRLFPIAEIVTPNIPEAELISGQNITSREDMEKAAKMISETYGCAVLCKGGHSVNDADDYLYNINGGMWFAGKRINNPNTHGTGCTLSSAVASNLAKGHDIYESVKLAKDYVSEAMNAMLDLGNGSGPLEHFRQHRTKHA